MNLDFQELYDHWLEFAEEETEFAKAIYRNPKQYQGWIEWVATFEAEQLTNKDTLREAYYAVLRSLNEEAAPSSIDAAIEKDIADKIDLVLRKAKPTILGM